jgi:putative addiction module antidote
MTMTLVAARPERYNFRNHGAIATTWLKVRPIGASLGVVLPKEILARLNLKRGDPLHLAEAPDGAIRITTYDPRFEEQMRLARQGLRKFRNALRELA